MGTLRAAVEVSFFFFNFLSPFYCVFSSCCGGEGGFW